MKTKRLKISVVTTVAIFLFTGVSWADDAKNGHRRLTRKNHIRTTHGGNHGYQNPSHFNHRKYGRLHKKHYYRHRAAHRGERHALKHHYKHHRGERHALRHHYKHHRAERRALKRHYKHHRAERRALKRHYKHHRAERLAFKHRHKYHRSDHRDGLYHHKRIHKHYRKHKPSYDALSYRASIFEPGWSISIKTNSTLIHHQKK